MASAFRPTIASIGLRLGRTFTLFLEVGTAISAVLLRYIGRLVVMTPIPTAAPLVVTMYLAFLVRRVILS